MSLNRNICIVAVFSLLLASCSGGGSSPSGQIDDVAADQNQPNTPSVPDIPPVSDTPITPDTPPISDAPTAPDTPPIADTPTGSDTTPLPDTSSTTAPAVVLPNGRAVTAVVRSGRFTSVFPEGTMTVLRSAGNPSGFFAYVARLTGPQSDGSTGSTSAFGIGRATEHEIAVSQSDLESDRLLGTPFNFLTSLQVASDGSAVFFGEHDGEVPEDGDGFLLLIDAEGESRIVVKSGTLIEGFNGRQYTTGNVIAYSHSSYGTAVQFDDQDSRGSLLVIFVRDGTIEVVAHDDENSIANNEPVVGNCPVIYQANTGAVSDTPNMQLLDDGTLFFEAHSSTRVTNDSCSFSDNGIYVYAQGRYSRIARQGDPIPGQQIAFFGSPSIDGVTRSGRAIVNVAVELDSATGFSNPDSIGATWLFDSDGSSPDLLLVATETAELDEVIIEQAGAAFERFGVLLIDSNQAGDITLSSGSRSAGTASGIVYRGSAHVGQPHMDIRNPGSPALTPLIFAAEDVTSQNPIDRLAIPDLGARALAIGPNGDVAFLSEDEINSRDSNLWLAPLSGVPSILISKDVEIEFRSIDTDDVFILDVTEIASGSASSIVANDDGSFILLPSGTDGRSAIFHVSAP